MANFAGGLLQFIAGMWEFLRGNVFGATGKFSNEQIYIMGHSCYFIKPIPSLFYVSYPLKKSFLWPSSWHPHTIAFPVYCTFWMSYATIFIPGSRVKKKGELKLKYHQMIYSQMYAESLYEKSVNGIIFKNSGISFATLKPGHGLATNGRLQAFGWLSQHIEDTMSGRRMREVAGTNVLENGR